MTDVKEIREKHKIVTDAREQRQQWLNSLKVGDEVAVEYVRSGGYLISTVERITPTRRFTIKGKGVVFGNDGQQMGKNDGWGDRQKMHPVTEEIKQAVIRKEAITYINANLRVQNLTTQQLLSILHIIQINNDAT